MYVIAIMLSIVIIIDKCRLTIAHLISVSVLTEEFLSSILKVANKLGGITIVFCNAGSVSIIIKYIR